MYSAYVPREPILKKREEQRRLSFVFECDMNEVRLINSDRFFYIVEQRYFQHINSLSPPKDSPFCRGCLSTVSFAMVNIIIIMIRCFPFVCAAREEHGEMRETVRRRVGGNGIWMTARPFLLLTTSYRNEDEHYHDQPTRWKGIYHTGSKDSHNIWSHIRYCIWTATHSRRSMVYENWHFYDKIYGKVVTTRIVSAKGMLNTTSRCHAMRWSMPSDSQCKQFMCIEWRTTVGVLFLRVVLFQDFGLFRRWENERSFWMINKTDSLLIHSQVMIIWCICECVETRRHDVPIHFWKLQTNLRWRGDDMGKDGTSFFYESYA